MKTLRVTWTRTETFEADVEVEDHETEVEYTDERLHPFEDVDAGDYLVETDRDVVDCRVVDRFETDEPVRDDR